MYTCLYVRRSVSGAAVLLHLAKLIFTLYSVLWCSWQLNSRLKDLNAYIFYLKRIQQKDAEEQKMWFYENLLSLIRRVPLGILLAPQCVLLS